jgi:hypothetical protein
VATLPNANNMDTHGKFAFSQNPKELGVQKINQCGVMAAIPLLFVMESIV